MEEEEKTRADVDESLRRVKAIYNESKWRLGEKKKANWLD